MSVGFFKSVLLKLSELLYLTFYDLSHDRVEKTVHIENSTPSMGCPLILQEMEGVGMPSARQSSLTVSPGAYCWFSGFLSQYGAARKHNITRHEKQNPLPSHCQSISLEIKKENTNFRNQSLEQTNYQPSLIQSYKKVHFKSEVLCIKKW